MIIYTNPRDAGERLQKTLEYLEIERIEDAVDDLIGYHCKTVVEINATLRSYHDTLAKGDPQEVAEATIRLLSVVGF